MRLFWRIFLIIALLAALFLAQFALFGADFELLFSQEACRQWFAAMKAWGWLAGIGLLVTDLVLPVPATGIMAALGAVYGFGIGLACSVIGSTGAGLVGYAVARYAGRKAMHRLASAEELARFHSFFEQWGGLAIIASRMLPMLPEVMTILAGLARMAWGRFLFSLLLGTVPTAALFVWIGVSSRQEPGYGLALAVLLPLALWPLAARLLPPGPAPAGEE